METSREPKPKPKGALDHRLLKETSNFTVVFDDGKGMQGKLLGIDTYNLLIQSQSKRILIPKHSVKYIVL